MPPKRKPVGTVAEETTMAAHASKVDDMLASVQEDLNETFGDNTVASLSSAETFSHVDSSISTRSIIVDKVIAGGRPMPCSLLPHGRQTEISGLPGTGKTTLCAHLAAETQERGGVVVVTDTEERIDHEYWRKLGVNTDKIVNLKARTLEEVFERQYKFIELTKHKFKGIPILMLWDSLGGTSTDSIIDDRDEKGTIKKDSIMERAKKAMMVKAKLISAGMEIINPVIAQSKVAYVYTNTLYQKPVQYGDPWETPGGTKKNFFATLRLRLTVEDVIKTVNDATGTVTEIGHWLSVRAIKNSTAPMKLTMRAAVIGNKGYSNDYIVWEVATANKLWVKPPKQAWVTWTSPKGDEVKFQGLDGFFEKIVPHPEYPDLYAQVVESL
jgi:recombination protein RecA